ncbi:glycosyltransferase family 4 protein [Flavobacterium sp. TSSA_36]|uniref:glycosyltransferase family 4 protein n=1 Tax=Flavobacterium sp. TSSA_36 TaxID=3447669 RepID=UPI003F3ACF0D
MKIAILGNYLPRKCGIATFTVNLTNSMINANDASAVDEVFIVAINDNGNDYNYPEIVKYTIRQQEKEDYLVAADYINQSNVDLCIVQHEFGIFGGESGVFVLSLVKQLKVPVVTTLHTVLQTPSYHEKQIIKKLGELSQKMIVMSKLAIHFLNTIYEIPISKISFIHHGVPDFSAIKDVPTRFVYPEKKVMSTFGFLGRSKGIETVINALPDIIIQHPDLIYVVMGQTHPNVKRHCGEEYRDYLKKLAHENGVASHVIFEEEFIDEDELKTFLQTIAIYITPYLNECQITSGTISYALGAGACILSTPFWYAKELLANGRGVTFGFGDSEDLAKKVCGLLASPKKITTIKEKAYDYGKEMYWNKIGFLYKNVLNKIIAAPVEIKDTSLSTDFSQLPKFILDHIHRLTDSTGIVEHANYSVPDYKEGYCLDDNARALILVLKAYELGLDRSSVRLADVYLQYIKLMQLEDGRFHNDMSFDKKFLDENGSEDAFGRTIWAMGYLIKLAPNDSHFQFAKDIFFKALDHFENLKSIRALATTIIGISNFLMRYPDNERLMFMLNALTNKLTLQYSEEKEPDWLWFEPVLSYENAVLPLALWESYAITHDKKILIVAKETTLFLDQHCFKNGFISLVGNSWYYKGQSKVSSTGQQPIDAMALVKMYYKAWKVTKEALYYSKMQIAFTWFMGNNDLGIPLYDNDTKGCSDGLEDTCVNRNQGAESTISYLLSYLTLWEAERDRKVGLPIQKKSPVPLEKQVLTTTSLT